MLWAEGVRERSLGGAWNISTCAWHVKWNETFRIFLIGVQKLDLSTIIRYSNVPVTRPQDEGIHHRGVYFSPS